MRRGRWWRRRGKERGGAEEKEFAEVGGERKVERKRHGYG